MENCGGHCVGFTPRLTTAGRGFMGGGRGGKEQGCMRVRYWPLSSCCRIASCDCFIYFYFYFLFLPYLDTKINRRDMYIQVVSSPTSPLSFPLILPVELSLRKESGSTFYGECRNIPGGKFLEKYGKISRIKPLFPLTARW